MHHLFSCYEKSAHQPQGSFVNFCNQQIDDSTGTKVTFRDLRNNVHCLAAALYGKGFRKGDTVLLFLDRCIEGVYVVFAVPKIGGIVTPCRPSHTVGEYPDS